MFGLRGEFQSAFPICGGGRGGHIVRPICVSSKKTSNYVVLCHESGSRKAADEGEKTLKSLLSVCLITRW